jgi:hypothetical protein
MALILKLRGCPVRVRVKNIVFVYAPELTPESRDKAVSKPTSLCEL